MRIFELKSVFVYKAVRDNIANAISSGKSVKTSKEFVSVTRNIKDISDEFGSNILKIDISKLPKECKVIDIVYTWGWFSSNPKLCKYVTARTPKEWTEWAKESTSNEEEAWDMIEDEIMNNYSHEAETVITNLSELKPEFCEVVK